MRSLLKPIRATALLAFLLTWRTAAQPWSVPVTNATAPAPVLAPRPAMAQPMLSNIQLPAGIIAFDADKKDFIAKPGEINCPFVFYATNITSSDVLLTYIQTSCGCTTSKIQLPLRIAPGASLEIPISMNVQGKSGVVTKTVTIHTDKGQKVLLVTSTIQAPTGDPAALAMNRERNQQLAQADRQSVFKGDCARCHVEPLIGKVGKDLFTTACGICHEAEHRASMVPDLHQLKVTPNAEYWKLFIVHGKPGTLMPAFAQAQGGPLSDAQITSLVDYLVKEFPATKPPPAAGPAH